MVSSFPPFHTQKQLCILHPFVIVSQGHRNSLVSCSILGILFQHSDCIYDVCLVIRSFLLVYLWIYAFLELNSTVHRFKNTIQSEGTRRIVPYYFSLKILHYFL